MKKALILKKGGKGILCLCPHCKKEISTISEKIKNEMSADLMKLLEETPAFNESTKELRKNPVDFNNDPDFVADYLKAVLINDIITAMKENNINKNELAQKIGCSKQYIGRILNETTNYTIETIAKIACALGKEIILRLKI